MAPAWRTSPPSSDSFCWIKFRIDFKPPGATPREAHSPCAIGTSIQCFTAENVEAMRRSPPPPPTPAWPPPIIHTFKWRVEHHGTCVGQCAVLTQRHPKIWAYGCVKASDPNSANGGPFKFDRGRSFIRKRIHRLQECGRRRRAPAPAARSITHPAPPAWRSAPTALRPRPPSSPPPTAESPRTCGFPAR